MLRIDGVEQLEAMGQLPLAMDLARAVELGAHKVVRRVLTKGRTPGDQVDTNVVRLAMEMHAYDLAELMLGDLKPSQKDELVKAVTDVGQFDARGIVLVLDSLPVEPYDDDLATYRDRSASWVLHDLVTATARIVEMGRDELLLDWKTRTRELFPVLLAKYNMVDKVAGNWLVDMREVGLEAEAEANRNRYTGILKQRRLAAAKERIKQRTGRGGRR